MLYPFLQMLPAPFKKVGFPNTTSVHGCLPHCSHPITLFTTSQKNGSCYQK